MQRVLHDKRSGAGAEAQRHDGAAAHSHYDISQVGRIPVEAAPDRGPPARRLDRAGADDLTLPFIDADQPEHVLWLICIGEAR
jgi:hypothetical protein